MRRLLALVLMIGLVVLMSSCGNYYEVTEVVDSRITTYDELVYELDHSFDPYIRVFEEFYANGNSAWELTIPYTDAFDVLDNTLYFIEFGVFYNADQMIRFDRIDNPNGTTDFDLYFL